MVKCKLTKLHCDSEVQKILEAKDRYDSLFKKFDINDSGKLDKPNFLRC